MLIDYRVVIVRFSYFWYGMLLNRNMYLFFLKDFLFLNLGYGFYKMCEYY